MIVTGSLPAEFDALKEAVARMVSAAFASPDPMLSALASKLETAAHSVEGAVAGLVAITPAPPMPPDSQAPS